MSLFNNLGQRSCIPLAPATIETVTIRIEEENHERCAAVPTHLCGGKRLVGFAGYDDFVRLIGKE